MSSREAFSQSQFSGSIVNCYDSHVHWQATGTFRNRVQLHSLNSHSRLENDLRALTIPSAAADDIWLCGFGWDQNIFTDSATAANALAHEVLDRVYGDRPVFFVRIDGHAAWVNRAALVLAGLWLPNPQLQPTSKSQNGGEIQLKPDGYPSGILLDQAVQIVERIIPARTPAQIRSDILQAQDFFLDAGFTHIRDLSGDEAQWNVTTELERSKQITMAIEQFFGAEDAKTFDRQLDLAIRLNREIKDPQALVRPRGLKIFLDGALGSEGALLSCDYCNRAGHRGLQLLDADTLRDFISRTWSAGLPLAAHAIGDAAAHLLATTARSIVEGGLHGELHIEHAELLRTDTIAILKYLPKVTAYMQPCHWLSDKKWLRNKIGDLVQCAFRWTDLEYNGIGVMFGSDSPIEVPSLNANYLAIQDAAKNDIGLPRHSLEYYQSHPDLKWVPQTETVFAGGKPTSVKFCGKVLR